MTTLKNPLTRTSPLPCLRLSRTSTPLKSSLTTVQPILPDIVSSTIETQKTHKKKRVRFALKLEPLEENETEESIEYDKPLITKSNKRNMDPWRENGPLYGAYIEYFERKDNLTPEIPEPMRPTTPVPNPESPSYTHAFLIQSKSPEIVIDSITVSTPSRRLPNITQPPKSIKKPIKKPSSPPTEPLIKSRMNTLTPTTRSIPQSKKFSNTINVKSPTNTKRNDLILPLIKSPTSTNDKIFRTDRHIGTKIVNEYLQSKKLTEIITNPLPGTNNQVNYICGHSILPNLPKTPQTIFQNQLNNEPFFFQNNNNNKTDHFQPIIH